MHTMCLGGASPGRADARVTCVYVTLTASRAGSIVVTSGLWVLGSGAPGSGSRFRFGVVVGVVGCCSGFGSIWHGSTGHGICTDTWRAYGFILDGRYVVLVLVVEAGCRCPEDAGVVRALVGRIFPFIMGAVRVAPGDVLLFPGWVVGRVETGVGTGDHTSGPPSVVVYFLLGMLVGAGSHAGSVRCTGGDRREAVSKRELI
jgi:hypothetical protein